YRSAPYRSPARPRGAGVRGRSFGKALEMSDRNSRKVQRAIILAAGTGSRLVAQETFPKPLKPISGVPLLVRVLRQLEEVGIREAVIVIGYRGQQIREALSSEP